MVQSGNGNKRQYIDEHLDDMIGDDNYLYGTTGMDREEFEWIQERFKKTVENSSETPRFSEYVNDPGNTCILTASQILFVSAANATILNRNCLRPLQALIRAPSADI